MRSTSTCSAAMGDVLRRDLPGAVSVLRDHGVRFGYENHPEKSPQEVLGAHRRRRRTCSGRPSTPAGGRRRATTPFRRCATSTDRLFHVHLKDVETPGTHVSCLHEAGCARIDACVDEARTTGYRGALTVEHEPFDRDPTGEVIRMRELLEARLAVAGGEGMPDGPLRFAIVGCGNISGPYGETARAYPSVEIAGATDVDPALSAAFVERFGGVDYPSLEALLADPSGRRRRQPDLPRRPRTGHRRRARGGQARPQREADGEQLRGGARPRRARRRDGRATLVLADHLHGRRAGGGVGGSSTPARSGTFASSTPRSTGVGSSPGTRGPHRFYEVGPMIDVGVYPLTLLTAIFGPVHRVSRPARIVLPDRVTPSGEPFTVGAPDFGVALVELEDGTLVRLTTSFYVGQHSKQTGDRVPRRHRVAPHLELAGLRRRGRAGPVRWHLRAGARAERIPRYRLGQGARRASRGDLRAAPAPRDRDARRPRRRDTRRGREIDPRGHRGRGDVDIRRSATRGPGHGERIPRVSVPEQRRAPIPWEDRPPGSAASLALEPQPDHRARPPAALQQHLQQRGRALRGRLRGRLPQRRHDAHDEPPRGPQRRRRSTGRSTSADRLQVAATDASRDPGVLRVRLRPARRPGSRIATT